MWTAYVIVAEADGDYVLAVTGVVAWSTRENAQHALAEAQQMHPRACIAEVDIALAESEQERPQKPRPPRKVIL